MASFYNVAKGLLGNDAKEEQVNKFQSKLLIGYPETSGKGAKIHGLLTFLQEEVEPYRGQLSEKELEQVYAEARKKLVELTGDGVTGFLNPERVAEINKRG